VLFQGDYPTASIIADSGPATFELKALLLTILDDQCRLHPHVSLEVFVDDFAQSAVDDTDIGVTNQLTASTFDLAIALKRQRAVAVSRQSRYVSQQPGVN
jgi:hypothetical protein